MSPVRPVLGGLELPQVQRIAVDEDQVFARHQPVSVTVSAVRDLVLGTPAAADVLQALAWMAGIVLVFAPLAVRRYRRAV